MRTRTLPARLPATCLLAALLAWPASALPQSTTEVSIGGTTLELTRTSIKCETDETPDISTKRLVDCDSATLIDITSEDGEQRAVRFHIDPFDEEISSGVRAELRDLSEAKNGETTWYRFATMLPPDFPVDSAHRLVLSQWHERMHEGLPSLRPPLSHRLWNGRFVVALWNHERILAQGDKGDGEILFEIPRLALGVFHEFVYKITWSAGDDGEIHGWMRQCPAISSRCESAFSTFLHHVGQTGYPDDQVIGYYFKLGLYTVSEFDKPMTAFHGGYRSGPDAASVGFREE